jgi:hypothetical protein
MDRSRVDRDINIFCRNCHYEGKPVYLWDGSYLTLLILTVLLIVPAIVYVIWLYWGRVPVCPACGAKNLVRVAGVHKGSASTADNRPG